MSLVSQTGSQKAIRRSIDRHQQYGCLTVTHRELQVSTEDPTPLCEDNSRLWALADGGIKINRYPPAMTIVTVCFVSYVLFSVSKCPKVSDAHLKLI